MNNKLMDLIMPGIAAMMGSFVSVGHFFYFAGDLNIVNLKFILFTSSFLGCTASMLIFGLYVLWKVKGGKK